MRRVILQEFVSLDGLAAGSDGSVDFVSASTADDESLGRRQLEFIDTVDAILLGRVTYSMFADYWPNVKAGADKPFADRINALPKVVFSSTLRRAPWGEWDDARIVDSPAAGEIIRLKGEPGRDMVLWGSISMAQSLMDRDLIDEYQFIICPMVLGSGRRLFPDDGYPSGLELRETRSFDRGTVLLAYQSGH